MTDPVPEPAVQAEPAVQPEPAVETETEPAAPAGRRRMISLGAIALIAVALLAVLEIVGIALGTAGHWSVADAIGKVVIVLTVATLVLGVVAAVRKRGGRLGAVAAVLSILINPLVLIGLLRTLGGS